MRICAEAFLLRNFLMDFLLLALAARGNRFLSLKRLFAASAFAAVYSLAALAYAWPAWGTGAAAFFMLAVAFPLVPFDMFVRTAVTFLIFSLLAGSAVRFGTYLLGSEAALISGSLLLWGMAAFLKGAYRRKTQVHNVRMRVFYLNRRAEFSAIVDTGNLLREPISALPVMIADEKALGKNFLKKAGNDREARRVSYATVGGEGSILCLKADRMLVFKDNRWVNAPDMWLGVLPGKIRSGVHALVPGCVFEL